MGGGREKEGEYQEGEFCCPDSASSLYYKGSFSRNIKLSVCVKTTITAD